MKPDDEQARRAEIARGQWARQLMDNPLWNEAWDVVHRDAVRQWASSQPDDAAARDDAYHRQRVAREVRRHVEQIAHTGAWAEKQLEDTSHGR